MPNSGKATFRRMQTSLTRMDLLLDDILSIAQIGILEKSYTPVDLTALAEEAFAEVKNKTDKNPVITIHELCVVNGHRNYLYVLFYNLLQNAIKFNESDEPSVDVSCKKVMLEQASSLSTDAEYYKVTIADNGIGFDDADKERIFTIFEKLHGHRTYDCKKNNGCTRRFHNC